jgi:hypothetical protein
MNITKYLENEKPIGGNRLKKLLLKHGLLKNICSCCGISEWMNKVLILHLHHKDGNNKNNNLTNLELLCPNCHSQTSNYTGKNQKTYNQRKKVSDEEIIQSVINSYNRRQALLKLGLAGAGGSYKRIDNVVAKHNLEFLKLPVSDDKRAYLEKRIHTIEQRYTNYENMFKTKITWPDKATLQKMLEEKPCLEVAKILGVSDNGVRKKAKKYGIDIKQISIWSKKHGK